MAGMSVFAAILFGALGQFALPDSGELHVSVTDATGLAVAASVLVESDLNQVRQRFETGARGTATVKRLPFGKYRVSVTRDGFAAFSGAVDIRSAVPTEYRVTLTLAAVTAQVAVSPESTLVDPRQTTTVRRMGAELVRRRPGALPGRALPELVNTQPGWLLEAGGTLHPRGSENQTQYVVDGLPLTDNRSPGFAPELDADAMHALGILTGGYPAEYGRKLGGVIEVVTSSEGRTGLHGDGSVSIGSFDTRGADARAGYGWTRGSLGASGGTAATDRYLDPPVESNFTNHGRTSHGAVRIERDRFGVIVRRGQTEFMVPNDAGQEAAGQRQVRTSGETMAQVSYQRILSASAVASVHGMARDLDAGLSSNAAATPVAAEQRRGLREGYVKGVVSWDAGVHEWKIGGDVSAGRIRERFAYRITNPAAFDPDIRPDFAFADRAVDREQALFVQDQIRKGQWTVNAGIRWDAYRLVVSEQALSPRLAVAWSPSEDLAVRGSYDRAFQTPAAENILLASSAAAETIGEEVVRLPVRPSRGNFYEVAVSKALFRTVRLDASWFDRRMTHFADDEQLLNTGVSFPIAFERAGIHGAELKVEVPRWRGFSGSLAYAWMHGEGVLPITGGLFLDDEAELGEAGDRFDVSQDQRHTVRGRVSAQVGSKGWLALAGAYDSGLPFEFTGTPEDGVAQFGQRIVDRVDFATGRVRPALTVDVSAGITVFRRGASALTVQADVRNVTGRLRVINFDGLFSGTALATPRTVAVRTRVEF
jgi:TonB-dependent receptor-like protein/carboxypeptidase family protein